MSSANMDSSQNQTLSESKFKYLKILIKKKKTGKFRTADINLLIVVVVFVLGKPRKFCIYVKKSFSRSVSVSASVSASVSVSVKQENPRCQSKPNEDDFLTSSCMNVMSVRFYCCSGSTCVCFCWCSAVVFRLLKHSQSIRICYIWFPPQKRWISTFFQQLTDLYKSKFPLCACLREMIFHLALPTVWQGKTS